jgi:List-Bact-rpt repeat protein
MRTLHKKTGLPPIWSLLLVAGLAACASDSSDSKTVAVNLSLVIDGRQAQHRSAPSKLFSWIERWFPGGTSAWAQQSVTDIASIQVQITGPGIPTPASTTVPVSNPTSGQEIPLSVQAPVGPNRTITVVAFDGANAKIFGGTLPGVNLTAGAPVDLVITLVRLFTVTVQKEGNGSGTVTSTPPGIDCGTTCTNQSNQFEQGATVSLSAPAASGSVFSGWSGDCSGTGNCTLTGNATVTARFELSATNHLHVDKAGTGTGTVTSDPNGISCGTSCDADFRIDSTVTLTAVPSDGSVFSNWSGAGCSLGGTTCTVVMNANQNVTAVFTAVISVPMSTLKVEKVGLGSGTVTSAPSGIDCGGTCSADFPTGDTIRLTADPAGGSTFVEWTGACSGSGSCTVTMSTDQTVSARFDPAPQFVTLTVNKSGKGTGTVTDHTGAIVCGSVCQATYLQGTEVTLTATPDPGSTFNEWRMGPCNNQTGQCVLMMDRNRTVEANFREGGG